MIEFFNHKNDGLIFFLPQISLSRVERPWSSFHWTPPVEISCFGILTAASYVNSKKKKYFPLLSFPESHSPTNCVKLVDNIHSSWIFFKRFFFSCTVYFNRCTVHTARATNGTVQPIGFPFHSVTAFRADVCSPFSVFPFSCSIRFLFFYILKLCSPL